MCVNNNVVVENVHIYTYTYTQRVHIHVHMYMCAYTNHFAFFSFVMGRRPSIEAFISSDDNTRDE